MSPVKETIDLLAAPWSHICNLSFKHGDFPDKLKIAKILPRWCAHYIMDVEFSKWRRRSRNFAGYIDIVLSLDRFAQFYRLRFI